MRMELNKTTEQRFWDKVNKTNTCWLWTGATQSRTTCAYGVFRVARRNALAHRFSYELAFGTLPSGKNVCHSCDNPICVNPEHLFLGTQADNLADMRSKGRMHGASHQRARRSLSPSAIADIQSQTALGVSQRKLARAYQVSQKTIYNALHGRLTY
jgi:hypothetical protein